MSDLEEFVRSLNTSTVKKRAYIGRNVVAALAMSSLLGGCLLVTPPPARTFDLSAPLDISGLRGTAGQLLIVEPAAIKALAGSGIVVRPNISELNYFGGAQWSDNLPRLLQAKMLEAFESSGRTRAVGKPGDGLVIDHQIQTNLHNFDFISVGNIALVDISVKVVNDRNGRVIGTRSFTAQVTASSDLVEDAVYALDAAMDQVISDMVKWVLTRA